MNTIKMTAMLLGPVAFLACVAARPDLLGWLRQLTVPVEEPAPIDMSPSLTPAGPDYPLSFAMQRVAEPDDKRGLQVLGAPSGLRGSFCWAETPRAGASRAVPLVQRLDVEGGVWRGREWKLPPLRGRFGAVVGATWKNGGRSCLVRAMRSDSDVSSHRLYELDLARGSGTRREEELFGHRFLVEPSGGRYAYEISEPHSGVHPQLSVVSGGRYQVVSRESVSRSFSWSPRGTLLYCGYPKDETPKQNLCFPNIYENDLKGRVRLIKRGGFEPVLSPGGRHLAFIGPDRSLKQDWSSAYGVSFDPVRCNRALLLVLDRKTKRERVLARVGDPDGAMTPYPKYLWAGRERLCVVESTYDFQRRWALGRVRIYDTRSGRYTLRSLHKQKGTSSSCVGGKLQPTFTPIGIANGRFLLLQVQARHSGANNFRVLAVDLDSGASRPVVALTWDAPSDMPLLDWIDA